MPGISWQRCLIISMFLWVALNFYLAEKLSLLTTNRQGEAEIKIPPPPPNTKTGSFTPQSNVKQYSFDRKLAEDALATHGRDNIFQPLRAYVEKKLNDTVPGTIDSGNLNEKKPKQEVGRPGKWYVPLPLREGSPEDVSCFYFIYPYVMFDSTNNAHTSHFKTPI